MKKSLIVLILLALSFAGKAQERAVEQKTYMFEYSEAAMGSGGFLGGLQWYQEMALYVDGVQVQTFNIGNMGPTAAGFSVPVGSSWSLRMIRQYATDNGMHIFLPVSFRNYGTADNTGMEIIRITLDGSM